MKNGLTFVVGAIISIAVIYGMYWVTKTVSYKVFYQSMVQDTVRQMVKPEYLMGDK